jgi:patatin-like phospholipase/acyl hydrolase
MDPSQVPLQPDSAHPSTLSGDKLPFRLMSFDGGGLHAVSYLPVLLALEKHLGETIASSSHFHMLAGTSTGAIIAAALKLGISTEHSG